MFLNFSGKGEAAGRNAKTLKTSTVVEEIKENEENGSKKKQGEKQGDETRCRTTSTRFI